MITSEATLQDLLRVVEYTNTGLLPRNNAVEILDRLGLTDTFEQSMTTNIAAEPAPTRVRRGRQATAAESMLETLAGATNSAPEPVTTELTPDQQVDAQIQEMMQGRGRINVNTEVAVQEVKLYPYHVEMEINGIKKAISLMDFKQILDQQLQVDTKLEAMALPTYTYLFARSANTLQIASYYPERKMNLKYQPRGSDVTEFKDCIMPNVIITHTLGLDGNNWLVRDTKYIATNLRVPELPEKEFVTGVTGAGKWRMPFPNFYEDGRMCFGHNTMPMRYSNNLRGLDYFYKIIEDSPFNSDLGLPVPDYRDNIPGWFEYLATQDKFPYNKLRGNRGF